MGVRRAGAGATPKRGRGPYIVEEMSGNKDCQPEMGLSEKAKRV